MKLFRTKLKPKGTFEATDPTGMGPSSSRNKLNPAITKVLLQHESEPFRPQRELCMIRQPGNLASLNLPLSIRL
jgi:hypothetical protein